MTETIEQKALALVNEVSLRRVSNLGSCYHHELEKALCRAIEQHEAFRREVSDALEKRGFYIDDRDLGRFIIAKPDPLVEALESTGDDEAVQRAWRLHAALAARGLEIVKKEPSQ